MTKIVIYALGLYTKLIYDERGRLIEESFPVDENGEWLEGYETQWTTMQYMYDDDSSTPSEYRWRGWTEGCFWTDWKDYRD